MEGNGRSHDAESDAGAAAVDCERTRRAAGELRRRESFMAARMLLGLCSRNGNEAGGNRRVRVCASEKMRKRGGVKLAYDEGEGDRLQPPEWGRV